jgi:hypothetical protein
LVLAFQVLFTEVWPITILVSIILVCVLIIFFGIFKAIMELFFTASVVNVFAQNSDIPVVCADSVRIIVEFLDFIIDHAVKSGLVFLSWHSSFIEDAFDLHLFDVPDGLVEEGLELVLERFFVFEEFADVILSALSHVCDGIVLIGVELFRVVNLAFGHLFAASLIEFSELLQPGPCEVF